MPFSVLLLYNPLGGSTSGRRPECESPLGDSIFAKRSARAPVVTAMENRLVGSIEDESRQAAGNAAGSASDAIDVAIDVLEDIQRVVSSGRPKMLRVRLGDKVIAEFPVALTAAAAVAAGLAAVLLTKLAIEVDHED